VIAGAPVIISGSWDKTIFRWDSRTGEPIDGPLEGHSGEVTSVAFGVIDGVPVIVSGSWDKTIRYWDAQKGALIGEPLERHAGAVTSVAFGVVDGAPVIVSGGDDGTVRLWDSNINRSTNPVLWDLPHRRPMDCGYGGLTHGRRRPITGGVGRPNPETAQLRKPYCAASRRTPPSKHQTRVSVCRVKTLPRDVPPPTRALCRWRSYRPTLDHPCDLPRTRAHDLWRSCASSGTLWPPLRPASDASS
jgi:WD domain, G-beta repeat